VRGIPEGPGQRIAVERLGRHAIVPRSKERRVVVVASAGDVVVLEQTQTAVELPDDGVTELSGQQESRAVEFGRRIERQGRIEHRAGRQHVEDPAGFDGGRSAGRPGLVDGDAVRVVGDDVAIVAAEIEVDPGIAHERRQVLHFLAQPGEQREGRWRLRTEAALDRRQILLRRGRDRQFVPGLLAMRGRGDGCCRDGAQDRNGNATLLHAAHERV
jgi:hypothetical protein